MTRNEKDKVVTHHEKTIKPKHDKEVHSITRGPRPHRALTEAIPIAKARGIIQLAMSGPERVFDIAIVSKIPVTFARVMFAPAILSTIQQLADDFKEEIAQLRIIARNAAITAELWLGQSTGHGGSFSSPRPRWSRLIARANVLSRHRRLRT
jgi:hypothetical protein